MQAHGFEHMTTLLITLLCFTFSGATLSSSVVTGEIEQAEVITSEVGKDGKPILGAKQQADKNKQLVYGWR